LHGLYETMGGKPTGRQWKKIAQCIVHDPTEGEGALGDIHHVNNKGNWNRIQYKKVGGGGKTILLVRFQERYIPGKARQRKCMKEWNLDKGAGKL